MTASGPTALPDAYASAVLRVHANTACRRDADYPAELAGVLDADMAATALAEITRWEGYTPTPLHSLDHLATTAGVGALYYKDEGTRFPPGSFKALGGAYAVQQLLAGEVGALLGRPVSLADIREGRYREQVAGITVTTATDGNHGRSVAWGASRFGCGCVIYVHREVSDARVEAMARYGAKVIRVEGNYDDSVHRAQADAAANGWFVVSDTSYPGYTELPRFVMAGYTVMLHEILEQIPGHRAPTHVFVQGGCGGLAGAVAAYLWWSLGADRPRLVLVEPEQADCLSRSISAGERRDVVITEETLMAGLSCGEVSMLAWQLVQPAVDDAVVMTDELIAPTMRLLADGSVPVVAGESAVPGLAVLLAASVQPGLRRALGLDSESRVLVFGTEGATDPGIYRELVGRDAGESVG